MNSEYITERARNLIAYTAGEQPKDKGFIKLNTNENPYPPSPLVKEAVLSEVDNLCLYPDPDSLSLCEAIAKSEERYKITADNVFCGNSSDEVLSFVFCAFFSGSPPLLFPDISYSFYPVYAGFYGIKYSTPQLTGNFLINTEDYFTPACGVILSNPNAPTSVFYSCNEIVKILDYHKNRAVVAVDEAYIAFGGDSMLKYLHEYPNLIVIRTLSKSHSLAGLRLGFCFGQPHLITALRRVKNSFNSYPVDRLASAAGIAAISDILYYDDITQRIISAREWFSTRLKSMEFDVLPASGNFVFCRHKSVSAERIKDELRIRKILVRHFNNPKICNYLRITIGRMDDMKRLADVLEEITGGVK